MNIFEQYGGYEVVKQAISNYKQSGDMVTAAGLELQCLEYRRKNNIFEVGDYVCFKTLGDGYVHKYTKYHEFKYDLKHATDEEIEAGRIL